MKIKDKSNPPILSEYLENLPPKQVQLKRQTKVSRKYIIDPEIVSMLQILKEVSDLHRGKNIKLKYKVIEIEANEPCLPAKLSAFVINLFNRFVK